MASITVFGPVTASPPANTPGILVIIVASSANSVFHLDMSISLSFGKNDRSGFWLIAGIIKSASIINSESLIGIGLARPLASGLPSFILMHSSPITLPFSPIILFGAAR